MALSPDFLDRLRNRFLMSEVVGRYVALKKAGREFHGLCPFHQEKSPSFTVNDAKGFYHCFGCAAHGDAFKFLQQHLRLSFRESVEKLAREAGMELPQESPHFQARQEAARPLLDAMEAACRWFERSLAAAPHARVRDYVASRGIMAAAQARFRLGYAPDGREGLKTALLREGFTESALIEGGLLILPENGASYDRFRDRLMFPIRNRRGQVIAFGGRLLPSANTPKHLPKYLNSPETPLFSKGETLYNLDLAGEKARATGTVYIVEGYMDALAMAQAGLENTVATLGTAVTSSHLTTLWRYCPEPVLCLDGDAAGQRASRRALEVALPLVKPGLSLRFAHLPPGEDPDTLIARAGVEALRASLDNSAGLSETLWASESQGIKPTPEARAGLQQRLEDLTNLAQDNTVKSHMRAFFRERLWKKENKTVARSFPVPTGSPQLEQAFAALSHYPELLQEAEIEDALARLSFPPDFQPLAETYLNGEIPAASGTPSLTVQRARGLWRELMRDAHLRALRTELTQLESNELDEETWGRMQNLHSEINALQKGFIPAEPAA